jgi:hypothetical protein
VIEHAMALARKGFQPRPISNDDGPSAAHNRALILNLLQRHRHRRAVRAQQVRDGLLRNDELIPCDPIVNAKQPSCEACVKRMETTARNGLGCLKESRFDVQIDRFSRGRVSEPDGLQRGDRHPYGGSCDLHDCGRAALKGAQYAGQSDHPFAPD